MQSTTPRDTVINWHETFELALPYVSLIDLISLSTVSKAVGTVVNTIITTGSRKHARHLLLAAVQQTAACSSVGVFTHLIDRHTESIAWLLRTASIPNGVMLQDSSSYVNIPEVPLGICEMLVTAGVRISYKQLVSAARSLVQGVEAWVVAQEQLGVEPEEVPEAIAVLCRCQDTPQLQQLTSEQAVDLLHIALNMLAPTETPSICRAALFGQPGSAAIRSIVNSRVIDTSANEVQLLLQSALEVCAKRALSFWHHDVVQLLLRDLMEIPAAMALSLPVLQRLLQDAINDSSTTAAMTWLAVDEHPSIISMSEADTVSLLKMGIENWQQRGRLRRQYCFVGYLLGSESEPIVALSPAACIDVAQAALEAVSKRSAGFPSWLAVLFQMPGLHQVDTLGVSQLLSTTIQLFCREAAATTVVDCNTQLSELAAQCTKRLFRLPGSSGITAEDLTALLPQSQMIGGDVCKVLTKHLKARQAPAAGDGL